MPTLPEIARTIIDTISLQTGKSPTHPFLREGDNSDPQKYLVGKLRISRQQVKWEARETGKLWSRVDYTPEEAVAILGRLAIDAETDEYSRRRSHLSKFGINRDIMRDVIQKFQPRSE